MRPDMAQQYHQAQMMRNMQNGGMAMNMKGGNLARTAMANNQTKSVPQPFLDGRRCMLTRLQPASHANAPPSKAARTDAEGSVRYGWEPPKAVFPRIDGQRTVPVQETSPRWISLQPKPSRSSDAKWKASPGNARSAGPRNS
jgi:hypothetical protein